MTNFEEKLANLRSNLEAEKQAFKQERWAQIEAGTLAAFKQQQEQTCSEGILALQQQKIVHLRRNPHQAPQRASLW